MTRRKAVVALAGCAMGCRRQPSPVVVGAKNTTEQRILAEIIAQLIRKRLALRVERPPDFDSSRLIHDALTIRELDVYVEYSGTEVAVILGEMPDRDPAVVLERVRVANELTRTVEWMRPLGIDNRFAIVIPGEIAREHKLTTIEDAAAYQPGWALSTTHEFQDRRDGYASLMRTYSMKLRMLPSLYDSGLLYRPVEDGTSDMVAGYLTDGALAAGDLVVLNDNKEAFRSNMACIAVRTAELQANPGLRSILEELSGRLTNDSMRSLNYEVDVKHRPAPEIAAEFVQSAHLV